MRIDEQTLAVLSTAKIEGTVLLLTCGQLDRKRYEDVNKVLAALGGKWNRSAKGHVFPYDPTEQLDTVLLSGEVTTAKEIGFFPTPSDLAADLVRRANIQPGDFVLEPSAGEGALAEEAVRYTNEKNIYLVEVDEQRALRLQQRFLHVLCQDFLTWHGANAYDRIVMNPPFAKQQDIDHVLWAWGFLRPGGRLVSVMSAGTIFRENKKAVGFRDDVLSPYGTWDPIPDGTFLVSGTGVRTILVTLDKPATGISRR